MNDSENTQPQQPRTAVPWDGLGIGLFAICAGALLLAERIGWISKDVSWGFPLVVLIFGVVTIARALKK